MKKIAITGGIGSGKSEVLRIAQSLGYYVISADNVNKRLLQDENYLNLIKENFEDAFIDGQFCKKALSNIVFHDEKARLLLNSIAHKRIRALIDDEINKLNDELVFVEVPLLIESGMIDMFDEVIVVISDRETKIKRVERRDNMQSSDVISRMASQCTDDELRSVATFVIENNGTLDDLREKVVEIIDNIK